MTFLAISKNGSLDFGSDHNKARLIDHLKSNEGASYRLEKIQSKRTSAQNNALHLYFDLLANELNQGGYTVQLVLKEKLELDWTPLMVKELLWRPAQQAILRKRSTTELKKGNEIDVVWEHLNRHLGEKFGVHVSFPNNPEKDNAQLLH